MSIGRSSGSGLDLTSDQRAALSTVQDWLATETAQRPYLTLGGLAGTGKTTVIAELAHLQPHLRTRWCAYTRKAAGVLRRKLRAANVTTSRSEVRRGQEYERQLITTVHGLIKHAYEKYTCIRSGRLLKLDEDRELVEPICGARECVLAGAPECAYRTTVEYGAREPQALAGVDLVVVDEASMLGKSLWRDLLAYQVPVLAVGDHGQLPPVQDDAPPLMKAPDIRLEKIHRQAENSAIIAMAWEARDTGKISLGVRPESVGYAAKFSASDSRVPPISFTDDLMVLTAMRRTRTAWNDAVRKARGFSGPLPDVGERVLCLKNTQAEAYNGMLGTVRKRLGNGGDGVTETLSVWPDDFEVDVNSAQLDPLVAPALRAQFGRDDTMGWDAVRRLPLPPRPGYQLWDFGYAMTVHKSQGSEWPRVMFIQQRLPGGDEHNARLLYTAVTRAVDKVLVIGE